MRNEVKHVLFYDASNSTFNSCEKFLAPAGFECTNIKNEIELYEVLRNKKPVAILVDMDNTGEVGFDILRRLKDDLDTKRTGLMAITTDDDEDKMIRGYDLGADDYLINQSPRGIFARIQAIARRMDKNAHKFRIKDIEIDLDEHKVRKSGKPVDLTYIQFKLLYLLASRKNSVFSRQEILDKVWGRKVYVTNRTVDVHIKRLREKLGEYKYPSQYIETIHGTGYRFLQ